MADVEASIPARVPDPVLGTLSAQAIFGRNERLAANPRELPGQYSDHVLQSEYRDRCSFVRQIRKLSAM